MKSQDDGGQGSSSSSPWTAVGEIEAMVRPGPPDGIVRINAAQPGQPIQVADGQPMPNLAFAIVDADGNR